MSDTVATLLAVFFGFVSVVIGTAFVSVLRSGPGEIGFMRRKGFGWRSWLGGSLPKTASGASASELEGYELKAVDGTLVWARRTRTPTSEII